MIYLSQQFGCVPSLKGEVPDVKKVKPSLQASLPSEGFLFLHREYPQIFNMRMTALELLVIFITIAGFILTALKNNWTWAFGLSSNLIWLVIGLKRKVSVIVVSSIIYLGLGVWGAYCWVSH